MKPGEVEVWADGSCPVPHGPGGWAYILRFCKSDGSIIEKEGFGGAEETTNNRMELQAVIEGLRALTRPCRVTVHCDSEYVTKAFTDGWLDRWVSNGWRTSKKGLVLNVDLWKLLMMEEERHDWVGWQWVKGHDGIDLNERCDVLADLARPVVLTSEEELEHALDFALAGEE